MTERFPFIASRPRLVPPRRACDCHIHVFGPPASYPYIQRRTYTPPDALPEDAMTMLSTLGMGRAVFVQPSIYGTNNSRMLDSMATFGDIARGVAVVNDGVEKMELERLHPAGVRGVRLNVESVDGGDLEGLVGRMIHLGGQIREFNWHLELHVGSHVLEALVPVVERLPMDLVLDHMARIPADEAPGHPGLAAVQQMLGIGRCWVKLSGAYRVSRKGGKYTEVAQLARSLVETNPDRMVWGSDWPHTPPHGHEPVPAGEITPFRKLDTGHLLDLLIDWVPDERVQKRILVDNPARLYDYN